MRILGLEIKRAAPDIRVAGSAFAAQSAINAAALATGAKPAGIVRAAGQLASPAVYPSPVALPAAPAANFPTPDRQILDNPRNSWSLMLPEKMTPKQVLVIVRAAIAGDTYRAFELKKLMMRTWPMLRKCAHELRLPVAYTRFTVSPAKPPVRGQPPTDLAVKKADLIRRAMSNLCPSPYTDEKGWNSGVYDWCDAMLTGASTNEILWHELTDWGAGREFLPRAFAWAHPLHFGFDQSGVLTRGNPSWSQLFQLPGVHQTAAQRMDPSKFVTAFFKSDSGSVLTEGFMFPLVLDWCGVVFGQEWMLVSAQNYGAPFVDYTYPPNMKSEDLNRLDRAIEAGLSNRFIGHVEGTTVNVHDGQTCGPSNSQKELMERADRHCMELLLGTEATTKATPGKLGGGQGDSSQDKTKQTNVQGLTNWVASDVACHFVGAVLIKNYCRVQRDGTYDPREVAQAMRDKPTLEPDFTEPLTPAEKGAVMTAFAGVKVPMPVDDFYSMVGTSVPEEGDKVINPSTGEIGIMGSTDEDFDVSQKVPMPPPQMDENGNPVPPPEDDADSAVTKATTEELSELLELVKAAEVAPHRNGEVNLLRRHLEKITNRK